MPSQLLHTKVLGDKNVIFASAYVSHFRIVQASQPTTIQMVLKSVRQIRRLPDIGLTRIVLVLELVDSLVLTAVVYEYRRVTGHHIVRVAFSRPVRSVTYVVLALTWSFSGPD